MKKFKISIADQAKQTNKIENSRTYEAIVINGEDILLLRHHVTKATTSRVLKRYTRSFRSKDSVNVVPVVELVIETFRNIDLLRWISILDNDQMIRLKKRPPHLEEIEIPDSRNNDVELICQQRRRIHRHSNSICRINHDEFGSERAGSVSFFLLVRFGVLSFETKVKEDYDLYRSGTCFRDGTC